MWAHNFYIRVKMIGIIRHYIYYIVFNILLEDFSSVTTPSVFIYLFTMHIRIKFLRYGIRTVKKLQNIISLLFFR